ncbi:MAG: hypothetical protein M3Y76_06395 [Chloroflexota bacterium]|nr:hypothetical protein [Chloroflexota bacterium]
MKAGSAWTWVETLGSPICTTHTVNGVTHPHRRFTQVKQNMCIVGLTLAVNLGVGRAWLCMGID